MMNSLSGQLAGTTRFELAVSSVTGRRIGPDYATHLEFGGLEGIRTLNLHRDRVSL
jgi:hypothetical protein